MDEFNHQRQILILIDFLFIDYSQHPTWHNDLREAHLASHSCRSVHEVREVLPYLMDVSREQLQSHPQAWWRIGGREKRDQGNVRRSV